MHTWLHWSTKVNFTLGPDMILRMDLRNKNAWHNRTRLFSYCLYQHLFLPLLLSWNVEHYSTQVFCSWFDSNKLLDFQKYIHDLSTEHDREQLSLSFSKNKVSSTQQLSQTLHAIYVLTHTFIVYYYNWYIIVITSSLSS